MAFHWLIVSLLFQESVEMLLHLIWRHVCFYSSEQTNTPSFDRNRPFSRPSNAPSSLSSSQPHLKASTLRFLNIPDAKSFRHDASLLLTRLAKKIEEVKLVSNSLFCLSSVIKSIRSTNHQNEIVAGRAWRANQTYLEIMTRCLREASIVDSDEGDDAHD